MIAMIVAMIGLIIATTYLMYFSDLYSIRYDRYDFRRF